MKRLWIKRKKVVMSKRAVALPGGILLALLILSACQPGDTPTVMVEVEPLVEPYLSETPVPECISLPDVKLDVTLLSEDSAQARITGLKPNEPVYTIFSSQTEDGNGKSTECCPGEFASEDGSYEYSVKLRGPDMDREFTNWLVRVIHSRGAACAEFVLP